MTITATHATGLPSTTAGTACGGYLKLGLHGVVVEHHRRGPIGDLERRGARHLPDEDIIVIITIPSVITGILYSFPAPDPASPRQTAPFCSLGRAFWVKRAQDSFHERLTELSYGTPRLSRPRKTRENNEREFD